MRAVARAAAALRQDLGGATAALEALEAYSQAYRAMNLKGDRRTAGAPGYSNMNDTAQTAKNGLKAYELRDRASVPERFYIAMLRLWVGTSSLG